MSSADFLGERASLTRPPAFNGAAYMYWKKRMLIFLEACSLDVLEAVIDGPFVPTIAGTGDSAIPKPRSNWVSNCKTAKEMWDTLQQTHEGTTYVKRARINTLMHEYELFNMKKEESVIDNEQQINKVMRCLTREWQPKITAIADSKDLGSIKRKRLSLKVQAHQTKSEQEICTEDSNSETNEDSELGLLVRKFKKFMKKKDSKSRKPSSSKTHDNKITCFECGKTGHIKSECFQLQNKNKTSKICLTSRTHSWYLDSGCSNHMTRDKSNLLSLNLKDGGFVKYGDNNKGKILGIGDIRTNQLQ
ncbi:uncharacterized protein [Cicer arietinum]|uniref:uncharacterized protein n=1 Tax=Cicer arietinum TaxID=3827 RepID=UPI00032AB49A